MAKKTEYYEDSKLAAAIQSVIDKRAAFGDIKKYVTLVSCMKRVEVSEQETGDAEKEPAGKEYIEVKKLSEPLRAVIPGKPHFLLIASCGFWDDANPAQREQYIVRALARIGVEVKDSVVRVGIKKWDHQEMFTALKENGGAYTESGKTLTEFLDRVGTMQTNLVAATAAASVPKAQQTPAAKPAAKPSAKPAASEAPVKPATPTPETKVAVAKPAAKPPVAKPAAVKAPPKPVEPEPDPEPDLDNDPEADAGAENDEDSDAIDVADDASAEDRPHIQTHPELMVKAPAKPSTRPSDTRRGDPRRPVLDDPTGDTADDQAPVLEQVPLPKRRIVRSTPVVDEPTGPDGPDLAE